MRDQGDGAEALRLCAEGLRLRRELGDRWAVVFSLSNLADLLCARGDVVRATRLLGAADAIRQSIEVRLPPAAEAVSYTHLTLPTNREV